jgi:hypothetical protein
MRNVDGDMHSSCRLPESIHGARSILAQAGSALDGFCERITMAQQPRAAAPPPSSEFGTMSIESKRIDRTHILDKATSGDCRNDIGALRAE